jgi:membrane-bound lytic murein transglycosylase D
VRLQRARDAWLVGVLSLLAACSTPSLRPPAPVEPTPPPTTPASPPVAIEPAVPDASVPTAADHPPWSGLRERFAMQGCDYRPEVQRWARYYTQGARAFSASLKQAMPFLLLVSDEVARRDLPGEFALLPYLESSYQPIPSHGDRPAGMWQLVPDTARDAGLSVTADYDGRLDALASTNASLDLLARYYREFADWRLADMAFNSGEYRVRRLLGERDGRTMSADELGRLAFNRLTHEHLDRLLALACIVEDPQRFGVTLPEPADDDHLDVVTLEAGMDLRLAARFSATDIGDLRRFNAGYRRNRMPDANLHRLLLPSANIARFQAASEAVPQTLWSDWREEQAARTSGLASWATQLGVPVDVLAKANAIDETTTVLPNTRLLLPGREAHAQVETDKAPAKGAHQHVIVAGDTLSGVAHRYSIPLQQLKRMNPRASGTLRLGDKLRLEADAG